jgi:rRNA-processing protein FCF1
MEHYIILDTSSIVFAVSNKKEILTSANDAFIGYSILISRGILRELHELAKGRGKYSGSANAALKILEKASIEISPEVGYVDDWIVAEWEKRKCVICTNDVDLKKRLRSEGATVVSVTRAGTFR